MRFLAPSGGKGVSDDGNSPCKGTEGVRGKEYSRTAPDRARLVNKLEVGPGLSTLRPSSCVDCRGPPCMVWQTGGPGTCFTRLGWVSPGMAPGGPRSREQGAGRTAIGPGHGRWVLP